MLLRNDFAHPQLGMLDSSIRFYVAPFPDGFSPCSPLTASGVAPLNDFMIRTPRSAIESTPLVYQFPSPAPLAAVEAAPVPYEIEVVPYQHLTSQPPADGEHASAFFPPDPSSNGKSWHSNFDFDFPTVTGSEGYPDNSMFDDYQMVSDTSVGHADCTPITPMIVLHGRLTWKGEDALLHPDYRAAITDALRNSPWNHPIFLRKCLFLGSLWVGLHNPWNLPRH
ncbi:hypothetical protein DFH29DRAFT_999304 [Suillus ampliporus]|nr:hypothetical protein DFH29DRAFT_999304 [Suillus ampliporus]